MDNVKFWVNACLKLALILLAGYMIYSWNQHKSGSSIDAEALKKIDSLNIINNSVTIENEKLKLINENLYEQVLNFNNQLIRRNSPRTDQLQKKRNQSLKNQNMRND